jgi:hypothetical protein
MTTNHKARPRGVQASAGLGYATQLPGRTSRAASSPGLRRMHRQTRAAYPSIEDEQNTPQIIENNQSRYALSVNFFSIARPRFSNRQFNAPIGEARR